MSIRMLIAASALLLPLHVQPLLAQDTFTAERLMQVTGMNLIFDQFGESIATPSPGDGIPTDPAFLKIWKTTALTVFDGAMLSAALETAMSDAFTPDEMRAFKDFYTADFGEHIVGLETAVSVLDPTSQAKVVAEGLALYEGLDPSATRKVQIDELLKLAGADLTGDLVRQSSRGVMIGMSLVHGGHIDIPWDEIDAQLEARMPAIEAEIRSYQQALAAYTYKDLTEAEIETYLAFLRSAPAQKLYSVYTSAVNQIVTAAMTKFGQKLAQSLTGQAA
jgi:hypothetical protein